jgi:hypothetical protein
MNTHLTKVGKNKCVKKAFMVVLGYWLMGEVTAAGEPEC